MPQSYSGIINNVTSQNSLAITAASNATPISITTASPHGWSTGDWVVVGNVGGNAAANTPVLGFLVPSLITVTGSSTFTLDGSAGSGAYTSGGTVVNLSLQPGFNEPLDGEDGTVASILTAVNALGDRSQYLRAEALVVSPGAAWAHLAALNWDPATIADVAAAAIDTGNARRDGTTPAFWSATHNTWILCGSNVAGDFYYGDQGLFTKSGPMGATPPKLTFGVDAANPGLVFFSSLVVGAATAIPYVRESPAGTFTKLTIASAAVSGAATRDAIVLSSGRIVLVGGLDSNHVSWTSDDGGATFSANGVGAITNAADWLDRVIIGASGRLVAWTNATSGNGGAKLWYSDNNGIAWTATSALSFASIIDAVYLYAEGVYVFLNSTGLHVTSDLVTFTSVTLPTALTGTYRCLAAIGSVLAISVAQSPTFPQPATELIVVARMIGQVLAWARLAHAMPYGFAYKYIASSGLHGQLCATGYSSGTVGFAQLSRKV